MELLLNKPSGLEKLLPLLSLTGQTGGSTGYGVTTPSEIGTGTTVTGGPTDYNYKTYERPFSGTPSNLVTRQGVTLQRGPMRSLVDIARESNILPGIQEIGRITGGYRENQPSGNPYAAPENMSFHEQGLAIDAGWWSERQALNRMLAEAGWNQFDRSYEPWHYSYGVTG
jgi:hypothetical protein